MLSIFKKKNIFFSKEASDRVTQAIREAEKRTSGEIRVYIEAKNPLINTLERAAIIFSMLRMEDTAKRNGVLLYIAYKHHEVALFADKGIHEKMDPGYWEKEVEIMLQHFKKNELLEGILHCIKDVGAALAQTFPYDEGTDKNELPDDIIFGK